MKYINFGFRAIDMVCLSKGNMFFGKRPFGKMLFGKHQLGNKFFVNMLFGKILNLNHINS